MFHALENGYNVLAALRPLIAALRKRSRKLAGQIEDAATGIAMQIAEGAERTGGDQLHLYRTAAGSCREVRSGLKSAIALGYLSSAQIAPAEALLDRESRLLFGLTRNRC